MLAALRGARFVTATETEEGRRWAESRIKQLTGGDKVRAYFMRQDEFEFTPQLKLMISGNHRPSLRAVDDSIRRRFNLIPFNVTIPREEQDQELAERLKAEWPGILKWMIDGCLEWQRIGLAAPPAVTDATAAYLEAEDAIAAWMDDQCERDPNAWEQSTALFGSWKAWAERSGEKAGNIKEFREKLDKHHIEAKRQSGTGRSGYLGLRLRNGKLASEPYWTRV